MEQREGDVGGVQYVGVNEVGTSDGGWCAVTMDSGAAVSVMPAWWYPREQKRTGVEYTVAGSGKIADMVEKLLKYEFHRQWKHAVSPGERHEATWRSQ